MKQQINERDISDHQINEELRDRIEDNFPTQRGEQWKLCKEIVPKIIQWLDSQRRISETKFHKMTEIKLALNLTQYRDAEIRKLIQLYREDADNAIFTKPKISAITGQEYADFIQFYGLIIASSKGYKFSRDAVEVKQYLDNSMEPRRVSLNKQTISTWNVISSMNSNKQGISSYQNSHHEQ